MARKTQVPIALKIKASRVFSLFLRHRQIKFNARRDLASAAPFCKPANSLGQRRPFFWLPMKKPRPVGLTGADGGRDVHAIGLRKGERFRLAVRWKQVIASSEAGVGYPVMSNESDNCRVSLEPFAAKPNFSITVG